MIYLALFLLALGLTAMMTPLAAQLGRRLGMVDKPGGRRRHQGVIPRTGGLAIFAGFFVAVLFTLIAPMLWPEAGTWIPPRNDPNELRRLTALLIGSIFTVAMGFLDDRYEFGSGPQYLVQFVAALIALIGFAIVLVIGALGLRGIRAPASRPVG